jgi:hypothetical protein
MCGPEADPLEPGGRTTRFISQERLDTPFSAMPTDVSWLRAVRATTRVRRSLSLCAAAESFHLLRMLRG